jgi:hypothetical protein
MEGMIRLGAIAAQGIIRQHHLPAFWTAWRLYEGEGFLADPAHPMGQDVLPLAVAYQALYIHGIDYIQKRFPYAQ